MRLGGINFSVDVGKVIGLIKWHVSPRVWRAQPRRGDGNRCNIPARSPVSPPRFPPGEVTGTTQGGWPAGAGGLAVISTAAGAISIPEMRLHPLNKKQTQNRNAERSGHLGSYGAQRAAEQGPRRPAGVGGWGGGTQASRWCQGQSQARGRDATGIFAEPGLSSSQHLSRHKATRVAAPRAQAPPNSPHMWPPLASTHLLRWQPPATPASSGTEGPALKPCLHARSGRMSPFQFIVSPTVT